MNIIQQAQLSSFKTNTITIANDTGSGNAELAAASGTCILMYGYRSPIQYRGSNYTINVAESCTYWINNSAAAITFFLPVNAPSGCAAMFVRMNGQINVNPQSGRIWASGLFKPANQSVFLTASGSKYGVISNGNNGWFPIIEKGTII